MKGVTLERDGVALFPDAPTERGVKHVRECIRAVAEGYLTYPVFVVQMKNVRCFEPNNETHSAFGAALVEAWRNGVHVLAFDCRVAPGSMELADAVPVQLTPPVA